MIGKGGPTAIEHVSELGDSGRVLARRLMVQAAVLEKGLQSVIGAFLLVIGAYLSVIWLGKLMSFTTYWVSMASIGGALALALYNINHGLPGLAGALGSTAVAIRLAHGEYREEMFSQEMRIAANLLQAPQDRHSLVRMAMLLGLELQRFISFPRRRLLWIPVLGGATVLCLLAVLAELMLGRGFPPGALFLPVVLGVLLYLLLDWLIARLLRIVTLLRHCAGELGG